MRMSLLANFQHTKLLTLHAMSEFPSFKRGLLFKIGKGVMFVNNFTAACELGFNVARLIVLLSTKVIL